MEHDLPALIEKIDSTPESEELIMTIYETINQRLHEPGAQLGICDELFESYCDLCSLESRNTSADEWWDLYFDFKCLRYCIQDGTAGRNLVAQRRTANINLIDGIVFYMRLILIRPRINQSPIQPFTEAVDDEDYSA